MPADTTLDNSRTTTPAEHSSGDTPVGQLASQVSGENFEEWYAEREHQQNILQGQSYFNEPKQPKDPNYHTPSKLLNCHRKTVYTQLATPKETPNPTGIFWIGSMIEEELILPFLQDKFNQSDIYVTNSIWVTFNIETSNSALEIKGATDPVLVDTDGVPILPTEVKSRKSLEHLDEPSQPHLAQTHAYMEGLSQKYDKELRDAVIIYVGRNRLNVQSFHIDFDQAFWNNTVTPWIKRQSAYREEESLPPANPMRDWECDYCPFEERCGEGEREYSDMPPIGLLPLFVYPRDAVVEYLAGHPDAKLTPTLAHRYPNLADQYPVHHWVCRHCSSSYRWDSIDWDQDITSAPLCPNCADQGDLTTLKVSSVSRTPSGWSLPNGPDDVADIEAG